MRPAGSSYISRVHASGWVQCDTNFDLQYLDHYRFCLISWRVADRWILYLRYWFSVTRALTWPIFHGPVILPYILLDYLMDNCHNWDIGSMWCKDLPHKMYLGQWSYISWSNDSLSYILKTFWWRNVVLKILLIQCDTNFDQKYISAGQWPTFRGKVILPYILNTIWWTSLILHAGYWFSVIWFIDLYFIDLAISNHVPIAVYSGFVNAAWLEIDQLYTQDARRRHPCTLDTFLVLWGYIYTRHWLSLDEPF